MRKHTFSFSLSHSQLPDSSGLPLASVTVETDDTILDMRLLLPAPTAEMVPVLEYPLVDADDSILDIRLPLPVPMPDDVVSEEVVPAPLGLRDFSD